MKANMYRTKVGALALAALMTLSVLPAFASTAPAKGTARGKVVLQVRGKAEADASGVVVYMVGFKQPAPVGLVPGMRQQGSQFVPQLLAITAGQSVVFPNRDTQFHNVFSLSPAQRFDLGQYKKGGSKVRKFPRVGIVSVYCNIHPKMSATILVLPNRAFTTTGKDGSFELKGVPAGTHKLFAYNRHASRPGKATVTVGAGAVAEVRLTVNQTKFSFLHKNKYGETYRKAGKY